MAHKTYFKFYRYTNFTIRRPKTDVCDFCTECEKNLKKNANHASIAKYKLHRKKAEKCLFLKNECIKQCKESNDILVVEFDYAQNLPLPKINVTKQFHKRLLWLFVFNIYCHNDNSSTFYTFLEHTAKKRPNTVASFLFNFMNSKVSENTNLKKIILLSDAAGGQNKNITMLKFCSWLTKSLKIPITHMFPVRGHSFGQCDRNSGLMKTHIKKKSVIETDDIYFEAIRNCRENPSPFELVNDKSLLLNWDKAFTPYFYKTPKKNGSIFGIQKYCIIKPFPTV